MNTIAKTFTYPTRYIYKRLYTTSDKKSGKMNLELSEIPTDEEIEYEVSNQKQLRYFEIVQSPI